MTRRRRSGPRSLALLGTVAMLLAAAPAPASAGNPLPTAPWTDVASGQVDPSVATCDAVPGRVLVRFSGAAGPSGRAAARSAIHGRSMHAFHLVPALELMSTTLPVRSAIGQLRRMHGVQSVQPDCIVHADQLPNDQYFAPDQWGLRNTGGTQAPGGGITGKDIDAAAGWDVRTDASSVPVAIIDTGVDLSHPDLSLNLWTNPGEIPGNGKDDDHDGFIDDVHGADFVNDDGSPQDDNGHGTHVAGIIGARGNNSIGVAGVAWKASLMPLKVLDANGSGDDSAIIAALDYAAAHGARITNNSYGGSGFDSDLYDAFVAAGDAGMLQVVAAGNAGTDNDTQVVSPGAFRLDSVISVAATDNTDALAGFSDYGATSVDIAAPGVDIVSTWLSSVFPNSQYAFDSGTSMATPMVTGVAALVAAQNSTWTPAQLRDWILGTTRTDPALIGKTVTGGVVDLGDALGTPALTATVALDATADTGVSDTDRITNADPLTFDVTFPRSVTGVAAGDFTTTGTAACSVGTPSGSAGRWQVPVSGCATGTVALVLKAGSVIDAKSTPGPLAPTASATVTIDRRPPMVMGLATSPLTVTNLSGTRIRLHVTWTGSDAGGAGIGHDELAASTTGGATWTNVSTTLATPVANVLVASTGSFMYRARIVDRAGNVGTRTGPNQTARLTQSTTTALKYSTGWTTASSTSYSGGSVRYATGAGRSVSFTFTGRSVAFVTTRASSRGQAKIYADGVYQNTVNLVGATMYRYVAWQKTWPTSAKHTIKLVVVGTSGRPRVDVDAFVVLS